MKSELVQRNEGRGRRRRMQGTIARSILRRPHAQSAPRRPDSPLAFEAVSECDLESVQLHAGVKALLKPGDEARPQVRLKVLRNHRQRSACYDKSGEKTSGQDGEPPAPAQQ